MNTIVKHKRTGNKYILLGINGELDRTNPSRFISELFAQEKSEVSCSATVCDIQGNIFLAYIDDLIVTEIDGKKPADILPEPITESVNRDAYTQPIDDFEDELEDEDLDNNQDISLETSTSSVHSQESSNQDDFEGEDDEDWI